MNVQELINQLEEIEDKTQPVVVVTYDEEGAEVNDEVNSVESKTALYSDPDSIYQTAPVVALDI